MAYSGTRMKPCEPCCEIDVLNNPLFWMRRLRHTEFGVSIPPVSLRDLRAEDTQAPGEAPSSVGPVAFSLLPLPGATLSLPLPLPRPFPRTFFSKSGSLKVKRNLRTCSDRSLSMLLASIALPRNSSTSSSGFALSWAFLRAGQTDIRQAGVPRGVIAVSPEHMAGYGD